MKLLSMAAAGLVALGGASVSYADTFTPGGHTATFEGDVIIDNGGVTAYCGMSMLITISPNQDWAGVTYIDVWGGTGCNYMTFSAFNYPVVVTAPSTTGTATQLSIQDARMSGLFAPCMGDLHVNWNNTGKVITFTSASTFGICSILGSLTQVASWPLSISK